MIRRRFVPTLGRNQTVCQGEQERLGRARSTCRTSRNNTKRLHSTNVRMEGAKSDKETFRLFNKLKKPELGHRGNKKNGATKRLRRGRTVLGGITGRKGHHAIDKQIGPTLLKNFWSDEVLSEEVR